MMGEYKKLSDADRVIVPTVSIVSLQPVQRIADKSYNYPIDIKISWLQYFQLLIIGCAARFLRMWKSL